MKYKASYSVYNSHLVYLYGLRFEQLLFASLLPQFSVLPLPQRHGAEESKQAHLTKTLKAAFILGICSNVQGY